MRYHVAHVHRTALPPRLTAEHDYSVCREQPDRDGGSLARRCGLYGHYAMRAPVAAPAPYPLQTDSRTQDETTARVGIDERLGIKRLLARFDLSASDLLRVVGGEFAQYRVDESATKKYSE